MMGDSGKSTGHPLEVLQVIFYIPPWQIPMKQPFGEYFCFFPPTLSKSKISETNIFQLKAI